MTATILEAAARSLVLAVAVGAGLALLRVRNVPARKAAWTAVLVASLGMPLLMRWPAMAGVPRSIAWVVPAPSQRAAPMEAVSVPETVTNAVPEAAVGAAMTRAVIGPAASPASARGASEVENRAGDGGKTPGFEWPSLGQMVAWAYLVVAGALLLRLLIGLVAAARLWATAKEVSPLDVPERGVRASARVTSPVTVGSGIVLPAGYAEWSREKLRMVLAHERVHVRQGDFYVQLAAGIYAAGFWFSPLGWWLRRELARLGEAMGDRAGMEAAASRPSYAEVVVEFAAMPRRRMPGVAMASGGNLTGRVERMLNEGAFKRAFAEGRRRALASLVVVPMALFAVTALVRIPGAAAQTVAPKPVAAETAPVPQAAPSPAAKPSPSTPLTSGQRTGQAFAGEGPDAGQVMGAPRPVQAQSGTDVWSPGGNSYAIVNGPGEPAMFSGKWNGDQQQELEKAKKVARGPFLWFRHDGKSYIVTNPAVVARLRRLYAPMDALGKQQAELGREQAALGQQQRALARQMKGVGPVQMPDMKKLMAQVQAEVKKTETENWPKAMAEAEAGLKAELSPAKMAEIQAQVAKAQSEMTPAKMAKIQAKLKAELSPEKMAELKARVQAAENRLKVENMADVQAALARAQAKLSAAQSRMSAQQGAIGAKMGALGQRQGKLGQEQDRLGAEQGRLGRQIHGQVEQAIREALRDGTARPVQ